MSIRPIASVVLSLSSPIIYFFYPFFLHQEFPSFIQLWYVFGFVFLLQLSGIVLGFLALKKNEGKGLAITGLVIGGIGLLIIILLFLNSLAYYGYLTPNGLEV